MLRFSSVFRTNFIILLVFCINVNSQFFREVDHSEMTETTHVTEDSGTTTTTPDSNIVSTESAGSVATVNNITDNVDTVNNTTDNFTTGNSTSNATTNNTASSSTSSVTAYSTANSPQDRVTTALGPRPTKAKVLNNLTMDQINQIPPPLLPYLFRAYSEALEDDENTMSLRRFQKHNTEYEIHIQKLKEVNGYKRHNLMIKEIGRSNDNPLIYINNPVEAKLPNAYLTLESFKKALENRANNARGKNKVIVIDKNTTKIPNSNKGTRPSIRFFKARSIPTISNASYKVTMIGKTETMKSIKNVTASTITDKSKTIQKNNNMPYKKLHETVTQKINDSKLSTINEGIQNDITTDREVIKETETNSETSAATKIHVLDNTTTDYIETTTQVYESTTPIDNTIPDTIYTKTKKKKYQRFKNNYKSSSKNTIKKRTMLARPRVFMG